MTCSWVAALATEGREEARELFWEAAQESHSYLMRNHATLELGLEQIRSGTPLDGLLLLRAPARDWLLRGDARVWSVLQAIAMGFEKLGVIDVAARLQRRLRDIRALSQHVSLSPTTFTTAGAYALDQPIDAAPL